MPRKILHILQNVEKGWPCFIGVGDGLSGGKPHFMKNGTSGAAEILPRRKFGFVFAAEGKRKIYEFSANTFGRKYDIICGVNMKVG